MPAAPVYEGHLRVRKIPFGPAITWVFTTAILTAIAWPIFATSKGSHYRRDVSNIKQLALGIEMYCGDYDGRYMDRGWMDRVMPYVKSELVLQDPEWSKPNGFAMNSGLSGAQSDDLASPENTVLIYRSRQATRNATGSFDDLRLVNDRALLCAADGHVSVKGGEEARLTLWEPQHVSRDTR